MGSSLESDIDVKKNRRKKIVMSVGIGGEFKWFRFYFFLVDDNIGGYVKLVRELRRGNLEFNFLFFDGFWFLVEEIIWKKVVELL